MAVREFILEKRVTLDTKGRLAAFIAFGESFPLLLWCCCGVGNEIEWEKPDRPINSNTRSIGSVGKEAQLRFVDTCTK